jgi:co-chaperonin GroES (HSP10)
MLRIKSYNRKKDSAILLLFSVACIGVAAISHPNHINALNNKNNNTGNSNSTIFAATTISTDNNLITNILAKNLEDHLKKAGAILEITSKLPQVRNVSYAHLLNQTLSTLHGIPEYADTEKRLVAKNIVVSNSDLREVFFIMPNGDAYLFEPYSTQQNLTTNNFAFRDYFQGAIKTNDVYLGNVIITKTASGFRGGGIAIPVYSSSSKNNSNISGVWVGGIDFKVFDKDLQSLNLPSGERVVYTGYKGQKIADSDINKSKTAESFATLNSFKNALNGKSGSTIDTIDNTKMLVTYQPVKAFHNTWVVLLMQPMPQLK